MFIKTVIRQGLKIHDLEKENNVLYEENKDLRHENEELNLAISNYRRDNKEMFKELSQITDFIEKYDYKRNNSVIILRKIEEVIKSDQTK